MVKFTTDVKEIMTVMSRAMGQSMADENLPSDVVDRISTAIGLACNEAIDKSYTHVSTIHLDH